MQPVSSGATALLLLTRPSTPAGPSASSAPAQSRVTAPPASAQIVGVALAARIGGGALPMTGLSQDGQNLTEMKASLYERVGRELGVNVQDYKSVSDYSNALKNVLGEIKSKPQSNLVIADLEHKLGLDDLGVSLDDVIGSMTNSDGQKKLNEALLAQKDKPGKQSGVRVSIDETGAYSVTR